MVDRVVEEDFTKHGCRRSVERRIPPRLIEWLLTYGSPRHVRGAEIWTFTKDGRKRLRRYLGDPVFSRLGKLLDIYAVVIDGRVVTVAHRFKRIPNA